MLTPEARVKQDCTAPRCVNWPVPTPGIFFHTPANRDCYRSFTPRAAGQPGSSAPGS